MTIAFSTPRLLAQVAGLVGAGVVGLSILSACDSDSVTATSDTTPSSTTSVATTVAPRTTELPPITATETVGATDGASPGGVATTRPPAAADDCAPDIGASAQVSNDTTRIAPPRPGEQWQSANAGGTRCPGLSYVYLVGPGGAPTEPKQLLIYHNGYFQGTGIRCNVRYQEVSASGPDAIDVVYRYDVADQPSQSPLGEADVTFRWNGSRVVMEGSLPYAITRGAC